jgi:hypothetical protein
LFALSLTVPDTVCDGAGWSAKSLTVVCPSLITTPLAVCEM